MFQNNPWLEQISEHVFDPERDIVDPHHHLWPQGNMGYGIPELLGDTEDGHRISQTVFIECGVAYREDGPEHLKCVGETEFAAHAADIIARKQTKTRLAAIVAHADLSHPNLDETLDAHAVAAKGLLRGIRHAGASAWGIDGLSIPGGAEPDLMQQSAFRRGVARLGERQLPYDTWMYHVQLRDFYDLARAVPGTTMVLDHFGTPLGVGAFSEKRAGVFDQWRDDIAQVATCSNVFAKLGGLAMPDNGFGWFGRDCPPTSDEFVDAQRPYYEHTIACFGPERCMFESNFPVDRLSVGYRVLWNAFKKMTDHHTEIEKEQMFSGVARQVYQLEPPTTAATKGATVGTVPQLA